MAAAVSHSNKTVAFNGFSLFMISSYHIIRTIIKNAIYIFNYQNKLFADYLFPCFHNIHCLATRIIKGIQVSPRFSIFYFKFGSEMNLVSSLFVLYKL